MPTIRDLRLSKDIKADLKGENHSSHFVERGQRSLTAHSSSSEMACFNLAISISRFSSGMLAAVTAGASVTIPFGCPGARISSMKLCGTKLAERHNWRTNASQFVSSLSKGHGTHFE